MAKSNNNVLTHGLSGKIGDLIVFSQRNGRTVVSAVPRKSDKEETEKQKETRRRFQKAVLYASVARHEDNYLNAAERKDKSAYNVAVADFLTAPNIEKVDLSGYSGQEGDRILITVTDDFAVKAVTVRITNSDGTLAEDGPAEPTEVGYEWVFTARRENDNLAGDRIEIFASDEPGNTSILEQDF
ncbi:MAG: hypothetical protein LBU91_08445 [Bacteroidales bacterium]|jgi:hypothetical protein|nr:hypothetical protein [Bacteroidales bacterium]